jgi:hypothetical protein
MYHAITLPFCIRGSFYRPTAELLPIAAGVQEWHSMSGSSVTFTLLLA